jgi:hypothetical protein
LKGVEKAVTVAKGASVDVAPVGNSVEKASWSKNNNKPVLEEEGKQLIQFFS